ncbi:HAD family hydrolase [Methylobacterium terricola]|nr:HAD-IA family hydrolase [Methylobacterium terricola]
MPIVRAVLFDADGVLQSPTIRWRAALAKHEEFAIDTVLSTFVAELARIETEHLETERDFSSALARLLVNLGMRINATTVLAILNAIDCDPEIFNLVRQLKKNDIQCYLASNQQQHRARHMSNALGYSTLFDKEFYSCQIGIAKPKVAFFRYIMHEIHETGDELLFIDDRAENVVAARQAGLHAEIFERSQGVGVLEDLLARHGITSASTSTPGD